MSTQITGSTAAEIVSSVRALRDRGELRAGDLLPPVRDLAALLGVNRNTATAAYRQLAQAGLVQSRRRAGTVITSGERVAREGFAEGNSLRDVGAGNPDAALIPDVTRALSALHGRPVLYGEAVIDPALESFAREWFGTDLSNRDFALSVTSGAVDAIERLLAQALTRDDAVAMEDPCFLANMHIAQLAGYRTVAVPVDAEGMTVEGLAAALREGVRAIVCTPRAQNPTGASLSPARAAALRAVLAEHPYVLLIEDDHFSFLAQTPYRSLIAPGHERYALVRSVSKFLGPDMCLALTATDSRTAERLAMRLSPGTTWVSHLLQRLTAALLTDHNVQRDIALAGAHYARRNADFAALLRSRGLPVTPGDGLSLWLEVSPDAATVAEHLRTRGWLLRAGDDFVLDGDNAPSRHLRLTVHDLTEDEQRQLASDLAAATRIADRTDGKIEA